MKNKINNKNNKYYLIIIITIVSIILFIIFKNKIENYKINNIRKYAILGYNTINIGDDIQSFVTSTLLNVNYIIMRDDYDKVYDFNGNICTLKEPVYLIMNGWFMHNINWNEGNNNIKFPIKHKYIKPIYISTCLSKDVKLLYTDECINHYKQYEPILCRDLTTQSLLNKKNVKTEFFGCITQLLDINNIPNNEEFKNKYENSIIYIDCEDLYNKRNINEKSFLFNHYINEIIDMNVKTRIEYAQNLLCKYKYAKKIYTTRLHSFLPCRAMGLNVEYVGDLNYRVKDLISKTPNKTKLKEKFYNYINNINY